MKISGRNDSNLCKCCCHYRLQSANAECMNVINLTTLDIELAEHKVQFLQLVLRTLFNERYWHKN